MDVIYYILFLLLFLIICSIFFKSIEGFDDKFYYDKLIDYKTIPNSYVNDSTPSRTINKFGFYKGEGTFKKGYSAETKSDEKISTLNKLLNRLLGRVVSDNNDCVGEFGKYSECDKSCGSNSYQTRTYNVSQERGQNGLDCAFEDGYKEKKRCAVDECQLGDICENNADCGTGNCGVNSTRCENMVPCDTKNVHVCDEDECIKLNDNDAGNNDNDNVKMLDGVYIYNNVDEECFFKTPAEIEELNLSIYTYDYRTISDQVKNLVLDCKYFQVKKGGVGPCVNGSNITVVDNEATCEPGFGPQPTMFNGSYACTKCLIINNDKTYKDADACVCGSGKIPELEGSTYSCEPYTGPKSNVCPNTDEHLHFVKFLSPGTAAAGDQPKCQPCPQDMAFKREGNNITCIPCAKGMQTLSSRCSDTDTDTDTGCAPELIRQNLTNNGGGLVGPSDLTGGNYQEQCVINVSQPLSSTTDPELTGCPPGVIECPGFPGGNGATYKCERGYTESKTGVGDCTKKCDRNQWGCAVYGEDCLGQVGDAVPTSLVCLSAIPGAYIDDSGETAPCAKQEGCADTRTLSHAGVPLNECVADGTNFAKCSRPMDGYFHLGTSDLVTNCAEYGAFFPKVGRKCIGACQHGGKTVPGKVAAEWIYKPIAGGGGDEIESGARAEGCPAPGEPGTISCSLSSSAECRFCPTRDNIKTIIDPGVPMYPFKTAGMAFPTDITRMTLDKPTGEGKYILQTHPSDEEDELRWNSPCISQTDLMTTYRAHLEGGSGPWKYNASRGWWDMGTDTQLADLKKARDDLAEALKKTPAPAPPPPVTTGERILGFFDDMGIGTIK